MASTTAGGQGWLKERIGETLDRVASERGARIVRDIRLDFGAHSQEFSHILIDRHGLLVIDLQLWPGARIHGSTRSRTWIARAKGASRERFDNPLVENARRSEVLVEGLLISGRRIGPDYVSGLVVFGGADTSGVSLGDTAANRMIDASEIRDRLGERYDFATNAGALQPAEIDDLVSLLHQIDRSDSPLPALGDKGADPAPIAPRLTAERYPDSAAGRLRDRRPRATLLVLLALVALAVWLFLYGGLAIVTEVPVALLAGEDPSAEAQAADRGSMADQVSVETAEQVLRDAAPEIYRFTRDLGAPEVVQADGHTTFIWSYLGGAPDEPPRERTIELTFDASGNLRGVSRE